MDSIVKSSIDARKNAFTNSYNITDESLIKKIDDLFVRINELGESCKDATEFETAFASSPLNQEYINLFTEIATTSTPITYESNNTDVKSDDDYIKEEIDSELRYQADSLSQPIRRELHQEAYDKARDIPVVGNALDIKQKVGFFSRFKKNNNE